MELEIYQVDSFTSQTFKGNPAGVCIVEEPLSESVMLSIAEEMALSETAFLCLRDMNLRWFTPTVEVKLCGHATLATAHIMKEKGMVSIGEAIHFNTLSGRLTVQVNAEDFDMDFPTPELEFKPECDEAKLAALGISQNQIVSYGEFETKDFIEIDSEQSLIDLQPNFGALKNMTGRGVLVTVQSRLQELDFVSRYFAPWVGINEDPVTGSAHCALAVFWKEKLGKSKLHGYQASQRGGHVTVEIKEAGRVTITGNAVTTLKGTLII
ncbi:PhzF family phenazine biosynthesis protein [Vibrio sp. T187]|uniref:PhzF family phenazine biosynthesis protein n=1 Tax=Vibrio TaxID=662 RepID=UPI0010C99364|nr:MULTISPECIES: PhzF family phenazine biosynthesis protein [Vibrio]MBW3695053.1 PhzF family phenazine biosynthesis protein [Vibrio sp. T187]